MTAGDGADYHPAPRRILLATDSAAPSGLGEHLLTLAHGLSADHEVIVAAGLDTGLLQRATALGLAVKAINPGEVDCLRHWMTHAALDIVHVHAGIGWEGHGIVQAARHAGVVQIVRTEHLPYLLTDPAQRHEHAQSLDAIDRLICVSEHVAESHRQAGIDPALISVIPNGITPVTPRRNRAALRRELNLADAPVLLMVGRFTPQKEHALLLAALPGVLAAHPRTCVLIAGDGPLLEATAKAIHAQNLSATVRLLGPRADCADLMAAADLLILPSRFEGMPLVLLEAMQAGLAVVATEAPGIVEAVTHGKSGWLSPIGDAPALTANIVEALANAAHRQARAATARQHFATHFKAQRMIRETGSVYTAMRRSSSGGLVSKTRIGFIGAGGIAHRHFGILEHFDDIEIVSVCDTDLGRATEAAARFGAKAYADTTTMLNDAALDAVYICVPPFAHGAPERAVMARGLPFFVEKPISLDLATAEAIAAEVTRLKLVTAVGYHWRYLETVDEVRGLLASNPARLMSGYWLDSTPPPQWWWHENQSGGQMLEQTTHLLDLARYLGGDVTRAYGLAGHTARPEFPTLDVPTVSSASLLFASGAIANFASTCLLGWSHRVGLHIFGDRMAIEITDRDLMVDTGHGRPVRGNNGDPVWHENRDFIDAVRGGPNKIRCSYEEALATQRLVMAVVESSQTGRAIELAPARVLEHV